MSSILVSKSNGDWSVVTGNPKDIQYQYFNPKTFSLSGYKIALFDGQYMNLAIDLGVALLWRPKNRLWTGSYTIYWVKQMLVLAR